MSFFNNFLLIIPILTCLFIFVKIYQTENNFFLFETFFALNVLSFCTYYLIKFRIHHSYESLNEKAFLWGILSFYIIFSINVCLYVCKTRFFFNKFSNFLNHIVPKNFSFKEITFLIFVGFFFFSINRTGLTVCENSFSNFLSQYSETLKHKLHLIFYFMHLIASIGLLLFINKVLDQKIKIKIFGTIIYFLLITIFFILILSQSASAGLIFSFLIISSVCLFKKSRLFFYLNLFYVVIVCIVFQFMKSELRKVINADKITIGECNFKIIENAEAIINTGKEFYSININREQELKNTYINKKGDSVTTEVSNIRYISANIFERLDFLQMLSQNILLIKNNELSFKNGETYINYNKNWQKIFGADLKQTYPNSTSAFNMPASVESYYNFGILGLLIFSITMGIFIVLLDRTINSDLLISSQKIILINIFSSFIFLENYLIFMIKNTIYGFILVILILQLTVFLKNFLKK